MLAALLLAACGSSPQDQVRAKVKELAKAAASRDYARICHDVLAPSLVSRLSAYGISCERAMVVSLGSVRDPTLSVGAVEVKGSTASVITLSMARGQRSSLETIELVRTGGGWRIASLRSL